MNVRCGNIRNKDSNLLTKDTDILSRWYEYGSGLYDAPMEADEDILEQLWPNCKRDVHEPDLLESEIRTAVSKIKSWKAPGIKGELIKGGGEAVVHAQDFPTLWTMSLVVTIPKKGNTTKCENHHTISLICHSSKIILEMIRSRIRNDIE